MVSSRSAARYNAYKTSVVKVTALTRKAIVASGSANVAIVLLNQITLHLEYPIYRTRFSNTRVQLTQ